MTILGVDPHSAKPYGYAVLDGERVVRAGECSLIALQRILLESKVDLVAVEDQYMAKNYRVAKALSWSAGKVMALAELSGTRCAVVNVATWKSKMRAQKGTHEARAEELFGMRWSDDVASAVLIAAYARDYY